MSTSGGTGSGKLSVGRVVTIIVLVLLIIGSGIFAYVRFQVLSRQAPKGSPVVTVTATSTPDLSAMNLGQLYSYVTSKPPSLVDPLDGSQATNWDSGPGCQFKQNAFHLTASPSLPNVICFLRNDFVQNFAFQVEIQFGATTNLDELQGGGIFFRTHLVQQEGYEFFMYTQSNVLVPDLPIYGAFLGVLPSAQVLRGWEKGIPNQVHAFNTLTIIALHHQINLYINNNQFRDTVTDSTFQGGQIGLVGSSSYDSHVFAGTFEVAFRNMKLWVF